MWRRFLQLPAGWRTKWIVLGGWLLLLLGLAPLAGALAGEQVNDAAAYAPHDAESSQVRDLLAQFDEQELAAIVVYQRSGGLTAEDLAAIDTHRDAFAARAMPPADPVVAPDEQAAAVRVSFADEDAGVDGVAALRGVLADGLPDGLAAHVTGPAGFLADSAAAFQDVELTHLLITLVVIAALLLLIYRSPVLWLVPLIGIVAAVGAAQGVVYLLVVSFDLTISGMTLGILTALVFGAGTDYALLLTARYREELRGHTGRHAAMRVALRRSAPAVLASGGTVVAAMLCLLPAAMTTNRSLGPVGAVGIAVTMLAMLTLFPALLVALGRWAFWPRVPRAGSAGQRQPVWRWVAALVRRRPRRVWALTALLLLALAGGLFTARVGVPLAETFTHDPDSTVGQQVLAAHFPGGSSVPVDVVVAAGTQTRASEVAADVAGVAQVGEPQQAGDLVHLPVVLSDPPESRAAEQTVVALRQALAGLPEAGALVGGDTATAVDTAAANAHDVRLVIPAVLVVTFLVLVALLRALVAPLVLLGTVVFSNAAAFGLAWLIFDHLLDLPGLDNQAVLVGFVFLVALGIDYNIFLASRAREEVGRHGHREGVLRALVSTGGVITSAGVVLAAAFTLLGLIPVVITVQVGVIVAIGVLIDTVLVRSLLTPGLLLDIGERSWWPGAAVTRAWRNPRCLRSRPPHTAHRL